MHWSDIEKIARRLEEDYGEEYGEGEIPEDNLLDIKEMTLSLDEFEDFEVEVSDSNLKQIVEMWIDIRKEK